MYNIKEIVFTYMYYLIIIITTLGFCCAGHGPLTLIKWPMLSGSIIICLCMQEKYYLDPSSLKKNQYPPKIAYSAKLCTTDKSSKLCTTDKSSFQQCPLTGRIHTRHPSGTSKLKDLQFRIEPCHDPEIKKNENNN